MNTTAKPEAPVAARSALAGKVVVIGIFGVAIAAAMFALAWNMSRSRRALAFWGPDNVRLIQRGETVELMSLKRIDELTTSREGADVFNLGNQAFVATKHIDLAQAKGLVHARHALTDDASFEESDPRPLSQGNWTHAVRFGNKQGSLVVLMDFERRRFAHYQTKLEIEVIPKIAEGWKSFIERHESGKN